jgi:predicted nucleotidyltransferase
MVALDDVTASRMRGALRAVSLRARPVAAFLFGSRAEGRADAWSDYDVAVFIDGAENWDPVVLARFCAAVQKEAGDDIELHVFPAALMRAAAPASFAAYVISDGIRLPLDEIAA